MYIQAIWAKRESRCAYCPEPITQEMIRGKIKYAGRSIELRWHPECWLEVTLAYLAAHPKIKPHSSGRPKRFSPEESARRRKLQNRVHILKGYVKLGKEGYREELESIMKELGGSGGREEED